MKFVAVTQRIESYPELHERRDCLDQRWSELLLLCGLLPLILPNNLSAVKKILDTIGTPALSGILLTGGNNLYKYGGDAIDRDVVERHLIQYSVSNSIPLIGVCRGMQAIQDYYGIDLRKVDGHIASAHGLVGSNRTVNSFHSLGTDETDGELRIRFRSSDGVVESIEHNHEKILGVMWHPERNCPFHEEDIAMIRSFFGYQSL